MSLESTILAALDEVSELYLFVTDREGTILFRNRAAHHLFGEMEHIAMTMESASRAKVCEMLNSEAHGDGSSLQLDQLTAEGESLACRYEIVPSEDFIVWFCFPERLDDLLQMVGGVIGDMSTRHRNLARGRRKDRRTLSSLREQLSQVRRAATTDALTGLANRRGLEEYFLRIEAADVPFSVFMFDLDGFKRVNDIMGHAYGDRYLQCFAQNLNSITRSEDMVARLGGDEFVIVAPMLEDEAAQAMKSRIAGAAPRSESQEVDVRVSVGVARYPEDGDEGEKILRVADSRMYAQKPSSRRADGGEEEEKG